MDDKKWLRMLYLYDALQHGEKIRKKDVAEHFRVSLKTIARDISDLEKYLDEQTPPVKLHYDPKDHSRSLTAPEQPVLNCGELLAVCKILLESRSMPKKEMDRILDKLLSAHIFSKYEKEVQRIIANERHHYMEPHHGKELTNLLWTMGQAIQSQLEIDVAYRTQSGEDKERTLQPVGLMFSEYYFYLTAFIKDIDQKAHFENADDSFPTIYRVDRFQSVKVTDQHFSVSYGQRFSEGEFRKRVQLMYGGKLQVLHFLYTGPSVEAVLDRLPTAKVVREKNGVYEIRAEVVFGKGIEMWMRSQGEDIQLL